jgi:hypothetical protein
LKLNASPLQLGRRNHQTQTIRSSPQRAIERHQAAAEDLGEGDVLGVVGASPAELLGYIPRRSPELGWIGASDRTGFEALVLAGGMLDADPSLQQSEMEGRSGL